MYITDYASQKNVVEDKAEIASELQIDAYSFAKVLNKEVPHIREKALVWLQRLASHKPAVAAYIIGIDNRSVQLKTPVTEVCDKPLLPSDHK